MKWTTKDIDTFQREKEYVDTVLIPLLPLSFQKNLSKAVTAGEYSEAICEELERVYQGRLILSLPFTYQSSESYEGHVQQLQSWIESWKEEGVKHVVLLTSDSAWRELDQKLNGVMIWVPAINLHSLNHKDRANMCSEIAKDLSSIFTKEWS
ncbi:DUF2487 family protein [Alkalicoccobacillus plakortidis]|uniref:YpiF family protein n=1 Tax=Alkalicoccobacillus plakortidis TaxID=444060 RepID=A0ABT0XEM0_9BACI|nr:DUF2487 family protein [Alkalicoccobacillus plakortidis]MCM2674347.1 YpiF family protein [Alkalicoccobacillus plakortidis]